ncbi:O-antigen ligase family protein [Paeniglutamicibacter sp. NPDC012692]|uniref:O-antigen ligase family protein n=1 Tax=Paeniglutamicibacter sp. NPDC012692 TaxID=3364388 RepID=UPI003696D28A
MQFDAVTGLTVYVLLLLFVPSDRVLAQLGGAGTPAAIFSMGLLVWWLWYRVRSATHRRFSNPVTIAFALFCAAVFISEIVAAASSLPKTDQNAADMGLIRLASYAGVFFVAADGIPSQERLLVLCRRLVLAGTAVALLGIYQFATGTLLIDRIPTPGLSSNDGGTDIRNGYMRPRGTARHALEFAAVLSTLLPIALALAVGDRTRKLMARLLPVLFLVTASLVSLTRSALVGLVLGFVSMFLFWENRIRKIVLTCFFLGAGVVGVAMPQLVRVVADMFSGADSSVNSRTDSWDVAFEMFMANPWFGRGFGTFLPSYRILDNQLLQLLIEIGIIGLMAFFGVMATAVYCAVVARREYFDDAVNQLGVGLAASIAAGASLLAFFDAFSFPQAPGVLFLVLGLAAGYWRLSREQSLDNASVRLSGVSKRRAKVISVGAVLLVFALAVPLALNIRSLPPVYWVQQEVVFLPPASAVGGNSLRSDARDLIPYAAMVERRFAGKSAKQALRTVSAPIYGTGIEQGAVAYVPNAGGQWETFMKNAVITVEVVAPNSEEARDQLNSITSELVALAAQPQDAMRIIPSAYILTDTYPQDVVPAAIQPRAKWALLLLGFATVVAAMLAYTEITRRIRPAGLRESGEH